MDPVIYHTHHSLRSEDYTFWRDAAEEAAGPVLELGCGTGRILLRLIKEDVPVVGIDNDPDMLVFIRRMVPPTLAHLADIEETDMRSFDLGKEFPLIILPCNTLSTFERADRTRIYACVRRHLQPGGRFIFSMPNTLMLQELPDIGEVELEDEFSHPAGGQVEVFSSWQKTHDRITFQWRYDHHLTEDQVHQEWNETAHLLDSPQTYLQDLKAANLKPTAAYGDFYEAPFTPQAAYFILVATPV